MAWSTKSRIEIIVIILLSLLAVLLWYEEISGRAGTFSSGANFFLHQLTASQPLAAPVKNSAEKPVASENSSEYFLVARVVDGDTIELEAGEKVRYIGVDAPESVHPKKPVQCFGKEASKFNKSLVLGKKVKLIKDISKTDKYGRLLRYVYLADGTFVNLELVTNGYAQAATFPPDVKYSEIFVAAARAAREAERGLWGACR